MKYRIQILLLFITTLLAGVAYASVYEDPESFLRQAFSGKVPQAKVLWISGELRENAGKILQHRPATLRTRYWRQAGRSAWILEEIGKEQPITVGIVISDNKIESLKVLIYRESRGWEVKHPFFTDQFTHTQIQPDLNLNKGIDGLTGATLSVRALTKLSRLALFFHQHVTKAN